jgi:hypothetical protein
MNCRQRFHAIVAHGLVAAFLLALGLAVAPQLHERFHADAAGPGHECAVTLISTGKYEQGNAPIKVIVPQPPIVCAEIPALRSAQVPVLFLGAAIFEHAPPSFA